MIIDENTYFIGMTIVSNLIAMFLGFGMIYIQACKSMVKDERLDDSTRMGAEFILNEFQSAKYIDKIVMILKYGALLASIIITDTIRSVARIFKPLFYRGNKK